MIAILQKIPRPLAFCLAASACLFASFMLLVVLAELFLDAWLQSSVIPYFTWCVASIVCALAFTFLASSILFFVRGYRSI